MKADSCDRSQVAGVILAGGQARRMGGIDKGLVTVHGKTMCEIVIERLSSQVSEILINANRNLSAYQKFSWPVVPDEMTGFLGPLAGLASAMKVTRLPWIITAPCDGPFLNRNYVSRMFAEVSDNVRIVVARDTERMQPTFLLAQTALFEDLSQFLHSGERKIDRWFVKHNYTTADFSDSPDCFLNINTDEDRLNAEERMAEQ